MRVLILNTIVPFVRGGAEMMAENLMANLRAFGHQADIARIPFKWYPPERIADHMLSVRLLDVTQSNGEDIDMVVPLKFPVYGVRHPRKVPWLCHQHRTAYELWGTPLGDLHFQPGGLQMREVIRKFDTLSFGECAHIFTLGETVSERLQRNNGIASEPLYHPPMSAEKFRCDAPGDTLVFPSRITRIKRQHLAVRALGLCKTPVRLALVGAADSAEQLAEIRSMARDEGVEARLDVIGHVAEEEKVALYARALGVVFVPQDEDYGYITLEAMLSSKPVVTCEDSGGPLEFVRHEQEGLICPPDPAALAAAFDRLFDDRAHAQRLGEAGLARYRALDISWEHAIGRLLAH